MNKSIFALMVAVSILGATAASAQNAEQVKPSPKDKIEFDKDAHGRHHPGGPQAGRPGHPIPHEKFGPGKGQQHHFTPEEVAAREASFLQREYKLTDKQYSKVFEILREKAAVSKEARDGKITKEKARKKIEQIEKKMKRVLSKEQYEKWDKTRMRRMGKGEISEIQHEKLVK